MNIAIALAGGTGSRVGASIPKQFIEVLGKPMMVYTLEILEKNDFIDAVILVCIEEYIPLAQEYIDKYSLAKIVKIVPGGIDFTQSCMNGMEALRSDCEFDDNILIVSVDRPFISQKEIIDAIDLCSEYGSGIPARKCALCMFMVSGDRSHSKDYQRENLVQIQSPWAFKYGMFQDVLDKYKNGLLPPCENYPVAMVAAAGNDIYFSEGDPRNIKITEKTDIALMEQMLREGRDA